MSITGDVYFPFKNQMVLDEFSSYGMIYIFDFYSSKSVWFRWFCRSGLQSQKLFEWMWLVRRRIGKYFAPVFCQSWK